MRTFLTVGLLTFTLVQHVAFAEDEAPKWEQLTDISKKEYRGEPPRQAQIERAYKNCLQDVDEEASAFKPGAAFKKGHIQAESSVCQRSKRDCVSNPRSIDCKVFIDDYAD